MKTNCLPSANQLYDLVSLVAYDAVIATPGKIVISNPECRFWICFAVTIHFQMHFCQVKSVYFQCNLTEVCC